MFLVQETWLEPGIDPQIANYRLTKDDRIEFPHTVTRGGTAIYSVRFSTQVLDSSSTAQSNGLIHSGFAKHEATGILFLDIAKAFDKIWHDGLLIKLIRLDFLPLIKSIHSFLSDRSFRVRVDKTLSSPRPIRSGLPQGSLSSPLLFTLYVNDMPQTDLSHLAMFADDTAIITQNKRFSVVISNLQHYVSLLELWLTDWKIKVNASKSACLMFTSRPRLPVGLTPVQIFANPSPGTCCKVPRVVFRRKINFCPPHRTDSQKSAGCSCRSQTAYLPEGVNLRSGIRFFDKLPSVPNELIRNQPAYDPAVPSSQKRPRALLEHDFINFPQAKRLRV
ncbi:RNA-directed DNA polymerase from mobile element jockey [Trichonephila clavipes]|nr:RNA-directed DNA polymerase from mobile element jockey [Trichonephila clavipes]